MIDYDDFLEDCQLAMIAKKAEKEYVRQQLANCKKKKKTLGRKAVAIERGREIVQQAADETQKELEYRIGGLVTLALQTIFDKRYSCTIQFVPRRGKVEADIILNKGDLVLDEIMDSSGGGVGDVMSFALRVSLWALKKNRPLFILDEPFKFVDKKRLAKCYALLKQLSMELGIQFIIVSHEEEMIYPCDLEIPIVEGQDVKNSLIMRRR